MTIHKNQIEKSVIVIGAGIAGCSTAYALTKRGINVTLVERHERLAQEASGNPVAILYPKYSNGQDIPSQLSAIGFEHTLQLLKDIRANESTYALCGQIQLAFNKREKSKLEKMDLNPDQQLLNKDQASEIAGLPLMDGGLYLPRAGWVNPTLLCDALTQSPLVTKMMTMEAITIRQSFRHWEVETNKNTLIEANAVIICNANDVLNFQQCKGIPLTPVRGQVNFFKNNHYSEKIKTILCSDHYLSPAIQSLHSIGTSYGPNDFNGGLSAIDTHHNISAIKTISPWLYERIDLKQQIGGRVAWRSATKDYLPLAGQLLDHHALNASPPRYNDAPKTLPWLNGLYVNAGHGSKGMITAPLCSEVLAAMLNNEHLPINQEIISKLNPSRFALKALGMKKLAQSLYPI